ncbi:MAG: hypothetical protein AB7K71_00225 [Polyangiaceae bacterium]
MVAKAFPLPSSARVDDLDLSRQSDEAEWDRRVGELGKARLDAARARLERMGILGSDGELSSDDLPADMTPDAQTTVETG